MCEAVTAVRAVRSRSDGGNQTEETDVREAVTAVRAVRSRSDGSTQTGKQTAAGGAAPLCGGEVAGVEAGES
jgi:hypothetical protein